MSTGQRHENEATNILSRAFGTGGVERVDAHGNTDPWHLADIICLRPKYPTTIVQVKTGSSNFRQYDQDIKLRLPSGVRFEVWERERQDGWAARVGRPDGGIPETREGVEWELYWETSTCDPSEVRDDWKTAFVENL
jgi:hypothetical protein